MPIHNVIAKVLRESREPLSSAEIYEAILADGLYVFKAQNPLAIVDGTLRRHCRELDFPSARAMKYFSRQDGKWKLLDAPVKQRPALFRIEQARKKGSATVVTVPSDDDGESDEPGTGPTHWEIQWRLLDLGSQMGLSVWCPQSDRGRLWNEKQLGGIPRILNKLPTQFDAATNKTIENIDVLWLEGQAILAGFEVEHTTQIYSGLLRMSDLVAMQPNIDIRLFLVSPDERFGKFAREVARPTFSRSSRKPLHSLCKFLPYTSLLRRLEEAKDLVRYLKPEFLNDVAEEYNPEAEFAAES
ncbi:MAG: hypothetical protein U0791_11110 [Gemmataceae bacterium]